MIPDFRYAVDGCNQSSNFTNSSHALASMAEPTESDLARLEAESSVTEAEVAAVDAESKLLAAIDRLAKAQAHVWLLRCDAEGAA